MKRQVDRLIDVHTYTHKLHGLVLRLCWMNHMPLARSYEGRKFYGLYSEES